MPKRNSFLVKKDDSRPGEASKAWVYTKNAVLRLGAVFVYHFLSFEIICTSIISHLNIYIARMALTKGDEMIEHATLNTVTTNSIDRRKLTQRVLLKLDLRYESILHGDA